MQDDLPVSLDVFGMFWGSNSLSNNDNRESMLFDKIYLTAF